MGVSAKAKRSSDGWGWDLFLVFSPDEDTHLGKKKNLLCSSPSSIKSTTTTSRRTQSNLLITRAQSTLSICALAVFLTLLLFTLCQFEPTNPSSLSPTKTQIGASRRWLLDNPSKNYRDKNKKKNSRLSSLFGSRYTRRHKSSRDSSIALQGMGTLFRRGTVAMNDLIVGHLMEDTKEEELRLFLRTLHRSGLTARSDLLLIFPSPIAAASKFSTVIREENDSFLKLVRYYREYNDSNTESVIGFNATQFVKSTKKKGNHGGESLWGRRTRSNQSNPEREDTEFTELSFGSVVGFEVTELDPENSLAGFFDNVPMSLRRWACYPMLLGRVRRSFKHLMLVDVKNVVVLGDALGRVRNRSPESVYLSTMASTVHGKHGRKESKPPLIPGVIMGGVRGVRRLSNAMLTEIVRAAIQHKSKNSVSESGLLNKLVCNRLVLKNIDVVTSTELIPDTSSLASRNSGSSSSWSSSSSSSSSSDYSIVHRGHDSNLNLNSIILKEICSSPLDSCVYKDC